MECECGCGRKAMPGGRLASACYKQLARTGSTRRTKTPPRYDTPREMVRQAAEGLIEADGFDGKAMHRAWSRFWMAVRRYKAKRNNVQKGTHSP